MPNELNPKQAKFVAEYLKGGNATEAYIAAGYSPKGADRAAARLLGNVGVSKAVEEGLASISKESEVSAISLMRDLDTIKERCMQGEPVLDNEGCPTGEWKFDSRGALKAIELMGKRLGMWTPEEKPPDEPLPLMGGERGELSTTQLIHLILEKRSRLAAPPAEREVVPQPTPKPKEESKKPEPELPSFAGMQEFPNK